MTPVKTRPSFIWNTMALYAGATSRSGLAIASKTSARETPRRTGKPRAERALDRVAGLAPARPERRRPAGRIAVVPWRLLEERPPRTVVIGPAAEARAHVRVRRGEPVEERPVGRPEG